MKKIMIFLLLTSCNTSVGRYITKTYDIIQPHHVSLHELEYFINILELKHHILIDVREKSEYDKGHISGSISIPIKYINEVSNIPDLNSKNLIFYDKEKPRIKYILNRIQNITTNTNIYFLKNGFNFWIGKIEGTEKETILEENKENREKYDL